MKSMTKFLSKRLDAATLDSLADFICGDDREKFPEYRSSSCLTRFFQKVNIQATHDGSTRKRWVLELLKQLSLSHLEAVILRLVDVREYKGDCDKLRMAAKAMNDILFMENMEVTFQGRDPLLKVLKDSADPIIGDSNSGNDSSSEEEFLEKEFKENDIAKLGLDDAIVLTLKERIREARQCASHRAALSSVIMSGSTLEGILLGVAVINPTSFQSAKASPKDKSGKVLQIPDWKLVALIDVAYELGLLGLDVKKFGHALRDFRNYIHPFEQYSSGFTPDEHTAKICLQVLNAAIADLIRASGNRV
jgi:hypothetical protein